MRLDRKHRVEGGAQNLKSEGENVSLVDNYIDKKSPNGKIRVARTENIIVNPIRIIPKQHQPGKFNLIVDLICGSPRASAATNQALVY